MTAIAKKILTLCAICAMLPCFAQDIEAVAPQMPPDGQMPPPSEMPAPEEGEPPNAHLAETRADGEPDHAQQVEAQVVQTPQVNDASTPQAQPETQTSKAQQTSDATAANSETRAEPAREEKLSPHQEMIKNLLKRNPFGTSESAAKAEKDALNAAAAPKGLELRAIYCVDNKWFFCISDNVAKTSYTLQLLGETSEKVPYKADFFDDETNSVSISNNLGVYTLTLKKQDPPSGPTPAAAQVPGAPAPVPAANAANAQGQTRKNAAPVIMIQDAQGRTQIQVRN